MKVDMDKVQFEYRSEVDAVSTALSEWLETHKNGYVYVMVNKIKHWLYGLKLDMQSRKILKELGYKSMKDFEKSCDTDIEISEEDTERMYQDLVARLKREGVWREDD